MAPRWTNMAPRWPQDALPYTRVPPRTPTFPRPRWSQEGLRWSMMGEVGPRWPKQGPRYLQDGPRWPSGGFNMVTRKLENGALAEAPCIFSQIALSSAFPLHVSSFLSFRSPEIAQNDSKMARDGLKMAPRWPPDGPQTPRTSAYLGVPRRTWGQFWVQDGSRRA